MVSSIIRIASLMLALFVSGNALGFERPNTQRPTTQRPNVVFMLADDLGYGDLGCTGHPYAKTPAIDQLASEGSVFRTFYTAGATCVPSRIGFMTGRFPVAFSKEVAVVGNINSTTVTEVLKRQGYRTGHFGKWGVGQKQESGTFGIDEIQVLRGAPDDASGKDSGITDATIDFIRKNKNEPFYVNVWFHSPHHPVIPHQRFVDRFADITFNRSDFKNPDFMDYLDIVEREYGVSSEGMRDYLGDVSQLDDQVARILKAIDDEGLRESTIIVFSSDNGPARIKADKDGSWGREDDDPSRGAASARSRRSFVGSAGPLRGRKHSIYEGGIRVPWIIRWPGRVAEGKIDESSVISAVDWLPTLASITGAEFDKNSFDGEDVSEMWLGKKANRTRDLFWANSSPDSPRLASRHGNWKYYILRDGSKSLYDLSKDPSESMDVIDENSSVAAKIDRSLRDWLKGLAPDSVARKTQPEKYRLAGTPVSLVKQLWRYRWEMLAVSMGVLAGGLGWLALRARHGKQTAKS